MAFLIVLQAPEPQWNTICRINSDVAYGVHKVILISLSTNRMHSLVVEGEGLFLF